MFTKIKNKLDKELHKFVGDINKSYSLSRLSPVLFLHIKDFILRKGKRVRPILFIIGYLGFAKNPARGLFKSAISLELLHDFMLVHDDIIDKSELRRGKPSMHRMLNNYLKRYKNIKFNGQDLAIAAGDVMYAMAIEAFLSIETEAKRKEEALKNFIRAAVYTGSGEFIELLLYSTKDIRDIKKKDLVKIYDLKTAHYTFASPLATGAILAGAGREDIDRISRYGMCLGRAFQIKDDIIGMFSNEEETGKPMLADLKEGKKTILIWQAYRKACLGDRKIIKRIFAKKDTKKKDLLAMRKIVDDSGALDYARAEIKRLLRKSYAILAPCRINKKYKDLLNAYSARLLEI
ncbi:MAG: polyprenyl synthetase family protein [Candidatus Omnitrophota bacterium]